MSIESSYQLKPGTETTVSLPSLATAGYLWVYEVADKHIIEIAKTENPIQVSGSIPGQSVDECFKITAKNKGKTTVSFTQRRPWEIGIPPNSQKTVTIEVV